MPINNSLPHQMSTLAKFVTVSVSLFSNVGTDLTIPSRLPRTWIFEST